MNEPTPAQRRILRWLFYHPGIWIDYFPEERRARFSHFWRDGICFESMAFCVGVLGGNVLEKSSISSQGTPRLFIETFRVLVANKWVGGVEARPGRWRCQISEAGKQAITGSG